MTFPSQTFDTVARIMSPLSNAIIDQNFREVSLFLHMMSTAMERQPGWVENVSSRLEGVWPERRTQLMEVTVDVFADANPHVRHVPRRVQSKADDRDPFGDERPTRTVFRDEPNSGGVTPATSRTTKYGVEDTALDNGRRAADLASRGSCRTVPRT